MIIKYDPKEGATGKTWLCWIGFHHWWQVEKPYWDGKFHQFCRVGERCERCGKVTFDPSLFDIELNI